MRKVAIVMGSKSDLPVAEKAVGVLRDYGVQMEVRVLSAHRCPNEAREFAASARADFLLSSRSPAWRRILPARWRQTPRCR